MTTFLNSLGWELRIQVRQGIYYAAIFVLLIWVVILFVLPEVARELLLPYAIFMDTSVFGMFFMAGLLYLERDERVLDALATTPRPSAIYLVTKLASLSLISLVITLLLTLVVWRGPVNWLYLLLGTFLNGWFLTMLGFYIAARYDSINEFLIPAIIYMVPTQLPALDYFGIWQTWLMYLIPTQGGMLLISGGFAPLASWQIVYSIAYLSAASIFMTWLAARAFRQFILHKRGEET